MKDINKVEMVQRRAIRWIHNYYSPTPIHLLTELQHQLNLRTLEQGHTNKVILKPYMA